jgi:hypothetical protein
LPAGLSRQEAGLFRAAVRKGVFRLNLLPQDREKLLGDVRNLTGRAAG